jgi:hypothetical protein
MSETVVLPDPALVVLVGPSTPALPMSTSAATGCWLTAA